VNPLKVSKLTTRPATKDDTSFARDVHRAAYREVVERQFGDWDEEQQGKFFAVAWNHPGFQILLWDDEPCGYYRLEDRQTETKLHELVLLPKFQGKGIGSALLDEAKSQAAKRGVPLRLEVLKLSRAASLYERKGLVYTGETDTHKQMEWKP
jgi:GNAT superfamily N-acetyltransferase